MIVLQIGSCLASVNKDERFQIIFNQTYFKCMSLFPNVDWKVTSKFTGIEKSIVLKLGPRSVSSWGECHCEQPALKESSFTESSTTFTHNEEAFDRVDAKSLRPQNVNISISLNALLSFLSADFSSHQFHSFQLLLQIKLLS